LERLKIARLAEREENSRKKGRPANFDPPLDTEPGQESDPETEADPESDSGSDDSGKSYA